jgi:site-specific DNA-adenine methylase
MAKKVTKTAEKIKEDAIKHYEYLKEKVKELESDLESRRKKTSYDDMTPRQRRDIQTLLTHIHHDHVELEALDYVLFSK